MAFVSGLSPVLAFHALYHILQAAESVCTVSYRHRAYTADYELV